MLDTIKKNASEISSKGKVFCSMNEKFIEMLIDKGYYQALKQVISAIDSSDNLIELSEFNSFLRVLYNDKELLEVYNTDILSKYINIPQCRYKADKVDIKSNVQFKSNLNDCKKCECLIAAGTCPTSADNCQKVLAIIGDGKGKRQIAHAVKLTRALTEIENKISVS
jgi:hypothetical protein